MSVQATRIPVVLILILVGVWLVLNGELSGAQLSLGAVLSTAFVFAISRLRPVRPRVKRLHLAVPLIGRVIVDILRSNFAVTRIVIGTLRGQESRSGFIDIPLELSDPHGLAMLAVIVTSTPGTSWAGVTPSGSSLKLHVLDLSQEQETIRHVKECYERPLRRIFE